MAESLSHTFGQIIGDLLEIAIKPHLQKFADTNNLFLDKKGTRKARGKRKKVTWTDLKGNKHDLDFVLEKGGTSDNIGSPVAFIETAWRRYTKHSRNKAQEIQSAIIPLAKKHECSSPFIGVVLAGEFTAGAISQLESNGFSVLYFSYDTVVKAFYKFGIDSSFDESTPEHEFKGKIDSWNRLVNKDDIAKELLLLNKEKVDSFLDSLSKSVTRYIVRIIVLPLHGQEISSNKVSDAINILNGYNETGNQIPLTKYEISIKYNTGDKIEGSFKDKYDSIEFLKTYL